MWEELIQKVDPINSQYHCYSLMDCIVHLSKQEIIPPHGVQYSGILATTIEDESNIKCDYLMQFDQNKQFKFVKQQDVEVQLKRSCDINDIWKQYVCLVTPIEANVNAIDFIWTNRFSKQGKRVKAKEKQSKKTIMRSCNKFLRTHETAIKMYINLLLYIDKQIDSLGKISVVKHPLLVNVEFLYENQSNEAPFIGQLQYDVKYILSYHKYDTNAQDAFNKHIQIIQTAQNLYYHQDFVIPLTKQIHNSPILGDAIERFTQLVPKQNEKLMNVHQYLSPKIIGSKYQIRGDYVYFHYMQEGYDDKGWGCAYRSFMTVLSWLYLNGFSEPQPIPTHKRIQEILVEMGDKESSLIGSSEWIGTFEVNMLISKLTSVTNKILHISSGSEIMNKLDEFNPIMFGGGQYAYTLLGIDWNEESGDVRFLILDPHYTASDNIKTIIDKGGVGWKKSDLFLENSFYNFCLPQVNYQNTINE